MKQQVSYKRKKKQAVASTTSKNNEKKNLKVSELTPRITQLV